MTSRQFAVIAARIEEELVNIRRLKEELAGKGLLGKERPVKKKLARYDPFMLRAVGSVLHDFYVAVENVFETVAREIDGRVPVGGDWHRELLAQMTLSIRTVRPPVVSRETAEKLDEFRRFRHVFRNVYGFNLQSERLVELLVSLPDVAARFEAEVRAFSGSMEEVLPLDAE
ncbi:MAG: hypothetical protein AB1776_04860 [Bacillota bacterium]